MTAALSSAGPAEPQCVEAEPARQEPIRPEPPRRIVVRTDELIAECQGLVRSLARQIHATAPRRTDLDDLIGYGQVGLAEAAKAFNPNVNVKFSTFAYYRIRGAIFDGLTKMSWFRKPEGEPVRTASLADSTLEQAAAGGRDSLAGDVRWLCDVSRTLATVYLTSHAARAAIDAAETDEDADDPSATAADREIFARLHGFVDALPTDAAALVRGVYFEGLTIQEAGGRLGIGKSWASRLHARALDTLGRELRRLGEDS